VVELGILPDDPRMQPRLIDANAVTTLNDRSVVVDITDFDGARVLKTDRQIEEELGRRLWETSGALPARGLGRVTVTVDGGVVTLGGLVPKNQDRMLAATIAQEPLEVRGVVNLIETADALAASAKEFRA
jgi:osmotically-inducible protein OsmY